MGTSVLIVEDNPFVLRLVAERMRTLGLEPICAADGSEASQRVANQSFSLIITDLDVPVVTGLQLLGVMHDRQPDAPIVVLAPGECPFAKEAKELGAQCLLTKPFSMQQLENVVRTLLDARREKTSFGTDKLSKNPIGESSTLT
jgi:DNA-binding NtrC family response regulator